MQFKIASEMWNASMEPRHNRGEVLVTGWVQVIQWQWHARLHEHMLVIAEQAGVCLQVRMGRCKRVSGEHTC